MGCKEGRTISGSDLTEEKNGERCYLRKLPNINFGQTQLLITTISEILEENFACIADTTFRPEYTLIFLKNPGKMMNVAKKIPPR